MARPRTDVGGRLAQPEKTDGPAPAQAGTESTEGGGEPARRPSVVLPTERRPARVGLDGRVIFLYGPPKIGKSTLTNELGERVLFFEMEPGLDGMDVLTTGPIDTWFSFCEWAEAARLAPEGTYDYIAVDTADKMVERCVEWSNKRLSISHQSDLDYGKGWDHAKKELSRLIAKLSAVPGAGLIFISHSQSVEIKTRSGVYNRDVPSMSQSVRKDFLGMADLVVFCDYEGDGEEERRVLRLGASRYYEAGGRYKNLPEFVEWPEGGGRAALEGAITRRAT